MCPPLEIALSIMLQQSSMERLILFEKLKRVGLPMASLIQRFFIGLLEGSNSP
jgi:hypothetical protein